MKRNNLLFCRSTVLGAVVLALVLSCTRPALAEEFFLFPSLTGVLRSAGGTDYPKRELEPAVDFFYSRDQGSWRILTEFLLTRHENELERFQIGWRSAPATTIWLGRFHTPISYWNTSYHHGAYLQPSISRPGIADYEDFDGILPMHLTGLLLEGNQPLGRRRLAYEIAVGMGPALHTKLEPLNLFSPRPQGKLSVSTKLSLQSEDNAADEEGVFAGYTDIPLQAELERIDQTLVGLFFNREFAQWRFLGELTVMQTRFTRAQGPRQLFGNAYLHTEYKFNPQWTAYARAEGSSHSGNAYVSLFPDFIQSRALLGARWTPAPAHAIKLEASSNQRQDGHRYQELGMQWSMVFP